MKSNASKTTSEIVCHKCGENMVHNGTNHVRMYSVPTGSENYPFELISGTARRVYCKPRFNPNTGVTSGCGASYNLFVDNGKESTVRATFEVVDIVANDMINGIPDKDILKKYKIGKNTLEAIRNTISEGRIK